MSGDPLRDGYTGILISISGDRTSGMSLDWQLAADRLVAALPKDERGPVYDYALAHSLLSTIFAEGIER